MRSNSTREKPSWCVIGGGMMGLTIAHRLVDAGYDVTVLEASGNVGGLADAWQLDDVRWDRHYHVVLLSDLHLRALLEELGLAGELVWQTTKTDFYIDDRFYPMTNALDYLRFPPLDMISKVRLALNIIYASRISNGLPLEKVPLEDWLVRFSGRRAYEKIWLPLLRAKLGPNHAKASAAFIWAVVRRLYAARRSGLKTERFGFVRGGYAKVLARFEQLLADKGVKLQVSTPVRSVRRGASGIEVATDRGISSFDNAVVTTAAPIAARICPDLQAGERTALQKILYQGIICPSVLLKRPLRDCYITYIADARVPFTAVIEMSALVGTAAFGGRSLVYLPCYVPSDDARFETSDVEIKEQFTEALFAMYPELRPDDIVAFRVSRARQVLAVSTLDYSAHLPPMQTSIPGLYIVNSAHIVNGTLNVNETVKLANEACEMLLASSSSTVPATRPLMGVV
jgi:protoporphyrinogen oxidase